jgi:hypothetical protein
MDRIVYVYIDSLVQWKVALHTIFSLPSAAVME